MSKPIFLIGLPGAGKTSIGRQIAIIKGYQFLDSDQEIVKRSGADIPWIFDIEGEEGFRRREQQVLAELCRQENLVLATGGGSILLKENREQLRKHGIVVYLRVSLDEQLIRTKKDKNRPLLQGEDPLIILEKIRAEREPLYLELADIIVDTDEGNVKDIAVTAVRKIEASEDN